MARRDLRAAWVDGQVMTELEHCPATLSALSAALRPAVSVAEVTRSLRRLKHAGKARCNVSRPTNAWHAVARCTCRDCNDPRRNCRVCEAGK